MSATIVVVNGVLEPDGTVHLDELPELCPGPVSVAIKRIEEPDSGPFALLKHESQGVQQEARRPVRLPDAPWLDESSSAPLDLPRPSRQRPVQVRRGSKRAPMLLLSESS